MQLKRAMLARRNEGCALLFKRLNVAIQKAVNQLSIPGSLGSLKSPAATNGTLMTTSPSTPTFKTTS